MYLHHHTEGVHESALVLTNLLYFLLCVMEMLDASILLAGFDCPF